MCAVDKSAKRIWMVLISLLVLLLIAVQAQADGLDSGCRCGVSKKELNQINQNLQLSTIQKQEAYAKHLPWGAPTQRSKDSTEQILVQHHYITNYDNELRVANWVAYRLTKADVETNYNRQECFRKDVRVSAEASGLCSDYLEPVFDQGHLVPSRDMARSTSAMINTYIMSNIAPQYCSFNRGVWLIAEHLTREWAKKNGDILVVSGSIFDYNSDGRKDEEITAPRMVSNNGKTRVAVPSHYYKIITVANSPKPKVLCLLFQHNKKKLSRDKDKQYSYFNERIVSVDVIEKMTGYDFSFGLSPEEEKSVESTRQGQLWEYGSWKGVMDWRCPGD